MKYKNEFENYNLFLICFLLFLMTFIGCAIGIPIEETNPFNNCYESCRPIGLNGDEYCEEVCP